MKPKFFCENCKREVIARDKVCPHCGRFFREVRCPRCSFTGEGKLFYDGCPNCGYLSSRSTGAPLVEAPGLEFVDLHKVKTGENSIKGKSPSLWTFFIITISLAIILGMLVYLLITG